MTSRPRIEPRASQNQLIRPEWADILHVVEPAGQDASEALRIRWAVPDYHRASLVPAQGFKLHLTANPVSAASVAGAAVPYLLERGIDFKMAPDTNILVNLNAGLFGLTQVGKFMTVYPLSNEAALQTAADLDELTSGLTGPRVPTDRPYRDASIVSYRYGVMGERELSSEVDGAGRYDSLELPDGTFTKDARTLLQPVPDWIDDPFPNAHDVDRLDQPEPDGPFSRRYIVTGAIQQRGAGGVYRAVRLPVRERDETTGGYHLEPGRVVVIKEARDDGECDEDGVSAQDRLRWQALMLQLFEDVESFPDAIEMFEWNRSLYLVMEQVEGASLASRIADGPRLALGDSYKVMWSLARAVKTLHERGVTHGDLSPRNVMVGEDCAVSLVDLEHCFHVDRPWGGVHGTPGFYPRSGGELPLDSWAARCHRDLFALAVLVHALFNPDWYLSVTEGRYPERAWARWPLPESVAGEFAALVGSILAIEPGDVERAPTVDAFVVSLDKARAQGAW